MQNASNKLKKGKFMSLPNVSASKPAATNTQNLPNQTASNKDNSNRVTALATQSLNSSSDSKLMQAFDKIPRDFFTKGEFENAIRTSNLISNQTARDQFLQSIIDTLGIDTRLGLIAREHLSKNATKRTPNPAQNSSNANEQLSKQVTKPIPDHVQSSSNSAVEQDPSLKNLQFIRNLSEKIEKSEFPEAFDLIKKSSNLDVRNFFQLFLYVRLFDHPCPFRLQRELLVKMDIPFFNAALYFSTYDCCKAEEIFRNFDSLFNLLFNEMNSRKKKGNLRSFDKMLNEEYLYLINKYKELNESHSHFNSEVYAKERMSGDSSNNKNALRKAILQLLKLIEKQPSASINGIYNDSQASFLFMIAKMLYILKTAIPLETLPDSEIIKFDMTQAKHHDGLLLSIFAQNPGTQSKLKQIVSTPLPAKDALKPFFDEVAFFNGILNFQQSVPIVLDGMASKDMYVSKEFHRDFYEAYTKSKKGLIKKKEVLKRAFDEILELQYSWQNLISLFEDIKKRTSKVDKPNKAINRLLTHLSDLKSRVEQKLDQYDATFELISKEEKETSLKRIAEIEQDLQTTADPLEKDLKKLPFMYEKFVLKLNCFLGIPQEFKHFHNRIIILSIFHNFLQKNLALAVNFSIKQAPTAK